MKLTKFFASDYVNYASYDNLRKIASVIDGQKNASRKILFTVLEKNINSLLKVSQLSSKAAEYAEYLHGDMSGVIVGLGQDYTGTNNIPLMKKKGNFGTRFSPAASAPRYIFTYGTQDFFELFKKEDIPILRGQTFEGQRIEPMFYVPSLPLLLINGSEGVSSGFAQKILPRNPDTIKKYITAKLAGTKTPALTPWYRGFNGTVTPYENKGQWQVKGSFKRLGINRIEITEVPIGYNLKSYIKVLDDLEDKKVIQGYTDKSEDDNFKFEVNIPSKSLKSWSDNDVLAKLKLVKTVTENYTVITEENKIAVYESAEEVLDHYIGVKVQYMQKRKEHLCSSLEADIKFDFSKYLFIKMIVSDELIINKRKKADIVKDLEKVPDILPRDDSYDYLLGMSISSLTEERMKKLEQDRKNKEAELKKLIKTTPEAIWVGDINAV